MRTFDVLSLEQSDSTLMNSWNEFLHTASGIYKVMKSKQKFEK